MLLIAVILAIVVLFAGGLFYVIMLNPFQTILWAMANTYPEAESVLTNLNMLYLWAPVFLILIPLFVYLIVKAMEERARGEVYYPA